MNPQSTVFLVDDNQAVRETLCLILETAGMKVESYPSARAFLQSYQPEQPGCLVLDVRMPEMTGLELQEKLRDQQIAIPIIFITGHGNIPMSVQAIKAGAIDFLEKPFRKQVLLERVNEALAYDAQLRRNHAEKIEIMERFERLTPREQQVMELVVTGYSNKEIAKSLQVSHRTVDIHRAHVMDKMAAGSLADLVAMAVTCGLREP